jgi:glycosyltransferase involved in cell wall biosynthesis
MPTFSVVVPAYNAAATITRALRSAEAQTYAPHEIIVVDDGSTDDTAEVVRMQFPEVVLKQQRNLGVGAARNTAFAIAGGDFVVFLDADDEWMPERLQRIASYTSLHPERDIVTTDAIVQRPDGSTYPFYDDNRLFPDPDKQLEALLEKNFIFVGAAIRTSAVRAIGGFDTTIGHQSEYEVWVRLLIQGSRAGLVNEPLVTYHHGDHGLSADAPGITRMKERSLTGALASGALSTRERAVALRRLGTIRRTIAVSDAIAALHDAAPGARRRAMVVVADREQSPLLRVKFAVALLVPSVVQLRDRRPMRRLHA